MAGKKRTTETEGDRPTREEETAQNMVSRALDDDGIKSREKRLATLCIEILDLEEEKTEAAKEFTADLKEKKKLQRQLATEIKTRTEQIPAQLALGEAVNERRGAVRGSNQDRGAPVKAPLARVPDPKVEP